MKTPQGAWEYPKIYVGFYIIVDLFTLKMFCFFAKTKTSFELAKLWKKNFKPGSTCSILKTDKGTEYLGDMLPVLDDYKIYHSKKIGGSHSGNAILDNLIRQARQKINLAIHAGTIAVDKWDLIVRLFEDTHNFTSNSRHGLKPGLIHGNIKFDRLILRNLKQRGFFDENSLNVASWVNEAQKAYQKFINGRPDVGVEKHDETFFYLNDIVHVNAEALSYGTFYPKPKMAPLRTEKLYKVIGISTVKSPFYYRVKEFKKNKKVDGNFLANQLVLVNVKNLDRYFEERTTRPLTVLFDSRGNPIRQDEAIQPPPPSALAE